MTPNEVRTEIFKMMAGAVVFGIIVGYMAGRFGL
jgi:hypothetical protein